MTLRVLNLGAGVGSTTVMLLSRMGEIEPIDHAIFADTGEEPTAVYTHLEWLKSLGSPPVLTCSAGKLGDDLISGRIAAGAARLSGRFTSIPAYTGPAQGDEPRAVSACEVGRVKRQCSRDYKISPILQTIRRTILGLKPRQRVAKGVRVTQVFGLDDGEPLRIRKVRERCTRISWATPDFPLARLGWDRDRCLAFLREHVPHPVPRSACVFCPFRSPAEWLWLRDHDRAGWERALEIDAAIRDGQSKCAQGLRQALYLHRSCLPLPLIDFEAEAIRERAKKRQGDLFRQTECEGMCGV